MIGIVILGLLATALVLGAIMNSRRAAKRGWVFNKHNPDRQEVAYP